MKTVLVAVLAVLAVGCSSTPSNKELSKRMDVQGKMINDNRASIKANRIETDQKIDRMFEKSQYK